MEETPIPKPDVSVAQIVLLLLAQNGRATFRQIRQHPSTRSLGAERSENSFYTALARLKRRRLLVRRSDHTYELTPSGEYAALKAYVRKEFTEQESEPRRQRAGGPTKASVWDGKWRIVLFDVPERKRPIRDYLRTALKRHGFQEFQRSMWVWPYRLPIFLTKLLSDPQMRAYTRVITTYDIDYDEDLRKKFKINR